MTGVPKKNAQIDTPNVLQLLRDTFGEVGDEKIVSIVKLIKITILFVTAIFFV